MKLKISLNAEAYLKGIEVEAENEEDAIDIVKGMNIEEMINAGGYVREMELKDISAKVISYDCIVEVSEIEYDLGKEDVEVYEDEYESEYDYEVAVDRAIEEMLNDLPDAMTIELRNVDEDDDIEELIADEITNKTGYLVNTFVYDVKDKK